MISSFRIPNSAYEVSFVELRLEDIIERLNRFKRADERPFEAVTAVPEFNQRAPAARAAGVSACDAAQPIR